MAANPFLFDVAQDMVARYGNNYQRLAFIFPNKRAALFLKKYLAQVLGQSVWAPGLFTIAQVNQQYTGLQQPGQLALLFQLYESFREVKKAKRGWDDGFSFDRFAALGEILLADFDDVDHYLAPAHSVFANIRDLAQIEQQFFFLGEAEREILRRYWSNFTVDKLSDEKARFLELWEDIPAVYDNFALRLQNQRMATSGMIARRVAQLVDEGREPDPRYERYVVVGFTALNAAERKFFSWLDKLNRADFYWDDDQYYLNDPNQEAGLFVRRNRRNFAASSRNLPPDYFAQQPKTIRVVGAPLFAAQTKLVGQLLALDGLLPEQLNEETAIVLANENLLFAVLQALPAEVEKLNVTMGFPLRQTNLYALLDKMLYLHQHATLRTPTYYYKPVLALLRHPLVAKAEPQLAPQLAQHIVDQNLSMVPLDLLVRPDSRFLEVLFAPADSPADFLRRMMQLLYMLFEHTQPASASGYVPDDSPIENEYIYHTYTHLQQIQSVLHNQAGVYSMAFLVNLLRKVLAEISIPFSGEPLEGLQIMGALETRNIDFRHVVVLGMNEGIWPKSGRAPSFISQSLRHAFQLPVASQQDAIYAYLFYRLVQRAQSVSFVYNNLAEGKHNGEMSRLLLQLIHESPLKVEHWQFAQQIVPHTAPAIRVPKDALVMQQLARYTAAPDRGDKLEADTGLTASAINTYIDCPLKFYFRYVAGIDRPDQVQEEVDAALLGTLLHASLELLYTHEVIGQGRRSVQTADFDHLNQRLPHYIEMAFQQTYRTDPNRPFVYRSEQLVMKEIVKSLAALVLQTDKRLGSFELISLEKKDAFRTFLPIAPNGESHWVHLKGTMDRVDRHQGVVRVIDYKTGKADKEFSDWQAVFDPAKTDRRSAVLQTFLYGLLYRSNHGGPMFPGIYDIQAMHRTDFSPKLTTGARSGKAYIDETNFDDQLAVFKQHLEEVLTQLFDRHLAFEQTPHVAHCQYCAYAGICSRNDG